MTGVSLSARPLADMPVLPYSNSEVSRAPLRDYSHERNEALAALARGLRDSGLDGLVGRVDYLYLADLALDRLIDSGRMVWNSNHKREMRELAKELTVDA